MYSECKWLFCCLRYTTRAHKLAHTIQEINNKTLTEMIISNSQHQCLTFKRNTARYMWNTEKKNCTCQKQPSRAGGKENQNYIKTRSKCQFAKMLPLNKLPHTKIHFMKIKTLNKFKKILLS